MTIYSIYKITNLINNKIYIGFSKNPAYRYKTHLKNMKNKNGKCYNYILYCAFRKYSPENFLLEIIYQSKDKEHTLKIMEPYFIKEYNSFGKNGYNMTSGGEGRSGIGKFGKENPMWGKKSWNNGIPCDDKTKQLISKSLIGKMAGEKNPNIKSRKTYNIYYKTGEVKTIIGLYKFCRENKYDKVALWHMLYNNKKFYKDIIKIEELIIKDNNQDSSYSR